ncbi:hypothetical protein V6255_13940 [Psychromonas arctica]|uniref:Integral membrane protein n=1 Tax=Psychromonas arctica TaxID=168275 RepID=A0ABU9HEE7_9GAMM
MNSKYFVLGGDIKKSLAEGYRFDLKKLLLDALKVTRKHFLPLLTACIFIMLVSFALLSIFIDGSTSLSDPKVIGVFFIFALLIAPPLMTGLIMMGVHHSVGLKTNSFHLFNYFKMLLKLSLAAMMVNLMTNAASMALGQVFGSAGFVLSIIVLLYLKMSFCLVYPLIAEKKVSPVVALKLSFKLVHKNIGQFTQLLLLFCALFIVGILTSGIGLLFVIPFCINVIGLVYRDICGVSIAVTDASDSSEHNQDKNNDHKSDTDNSDDDHHSGPKSGGFEA